MSKRHHVTHTERVNRLIERLRQITAKLGRIKDWDERKPLLAELRAAQREFDAVMHEDGSPVVT